MKDIIAHIVLANKKKYSIYYISTRGICEKAKPSKKPNYSACSNWPSRLSNVEPNFLKEDGRWFANPQRLTWGGGCQSCQYGKLHHLPFKSSSNRKLDLFELIHTYLMGPMTRTPSCSGFHYVMVLVDDYSSFTWAYFLK